MNDPGRRSISDIRGEARAGTLGARVWGQIEELKRKDSANGKPYWELKLRDASDVLTLRAWSDTPAYESCMAAERADVVEVEGEFLINGAFGLDARRWTLRTLNPEEAADLFGGELAESLAADDADVQGFVASIQDLRLRAVCELFLCDHGLRFRRAAAARVNHHAHRGGLLRHTAQMMRAAAAIAAVYPALNRDLLLAGVLFHDCGKLWEMCPPVNGFEMPRELGGELLGHISIGIELVNGLWKRLPLEDWKSLQPATDHVRLHLLHLIASHHGELEYGSPVVPKTPEAIALHYVDNLDARLEMIFSAYQNQPEIAPHVFERVRTLNTSPVRPLASISPTSAHDASTPSPQSAE